MNALFSIALFLINKNVSSQILNSSNLFEFCKCSSNTNIMNLSYKQFTRIDPNTFEMLNTSL
jgi:hypothetical protein